MRKRYTILTFIEKAKQIHKDFYDYSSTIFKTVHDNLTIICPIHGEFEQRGNHHLAGKGCDKCGHSKTGLSKRSNTKQFVNKAITVHGNKYDYSECLYNISSKKVKVICKIHGIFEQSPECHLNGCGCPKCGVISTINKVALTTTEFKEKSSLVHHGFYNYDKSEYINSNTKVVITCPEHGDFEQVAISHLTGSGCKKCSDENYIAFSRSRFIQKYLNKECLFYVVKLFNNEESFIKIGITGQTINKRFSGIPYKREIISSIKNTPDIIWDLENTTKKQLKSFRYEPNIYFAGVTECFTEEIVNRVQFNQELLRLSKK